MACCMKSFGLGPQADSERRKRDFMIGSARIGKYIIGYSGLTTVNSWYGRMQFVMNTYINSEGELTAGNVHTHCVGHYVWDMRIVEDITPKGSQPLEKRLLLETMDGLKYSFAADVLNADIVPSFRKGERLQLQMCAMARGVQYYRDLNEYRDSSPEAVPEPGIYPVGYIRNRELKPEERRYSDDAVARIIGTVRDVNKGQYDRYLEESSYFFCVTVQTPCGCMQLIHPESDITPETEAFLEPGAAVVADAVLSGDALIYEEENVPIFDEEHDLLLLADVFENGDANRLTRALSPKAVYRAGNGEVYLGREEVLAKFRETCAAVAASGDPYRAEMALIVPHITEEGLEAEGRQPCVTLWRGRAERFESVATVKTDEQGLIDEITVTRKVEVPVAVLSPVRDNRIRGMLYNCIEEALWEEARSRGFLAQDRSVLQTCDFSGEYMERYNREATEAAGTGEEITEQDFRDWIMNGVWDGIDDFVPDDADMHATKTVVNNIRELGSALYDVYSLTLAAYAPCRKKVVESITTFALTMTAVIGYRCLAEAEGVQEQPGKSAFKHRQTDVRTYRVLH